MKKLLVTAFLALMGKSRWQNSTLDFRINIYGLYEIVGNCFVEICHSIFPLLVYSSETSIAGVWLKITWPYRKNWMEPLLVVGAWNATTQLHWIRFLNAIQWHFITEINTCISTQTYQYCSLGDIPCPLHVPM